MVWRNPQAGADHLTALFDDGFGRMHSEGTGVGYAGDEKALVVEHDQYL